MARHFVDLATLASTHILRVGCASTYALGIEIKLSEFLSSVEARLPPDWNTVDATIPALLCRHPVEVMGIPCLLGLAEQPALR